MKYEVGMEATVDIVINNPLVIDRVVNNHDDEDRPEGHPDWNPERAWQRHLYAISTRDEVLNMLAYNALANGVNSANRLDGWGDLDDDAATMGVTHAELDWVDASE